MTKIELEKLLIKLKQILPVLEKAYRLLSDEELENKTSSIHLPCDSCEDKGNKNGI